MAWGSGSSNMGPRWSGIRQKVLRNSGGVCGSCGNSGAVEVDHIIPRHLGGSSDPANLMAVCRECHGRKSSAEGNAAQARKRKLRKRPVEKHPGRLYG